MTRRGFRAGERGPGVTERRVEYMPLATIDAAPRNPKRHATTLINASISRFGFAELPLLDERTGCLVAGHGRLDDIAARHRAGEDPPDGVRIDDHGTWLVPVVRGWASRSDAEAEAYLVASNKLTTRGGWHDDELADVLADLADVDPALFEVTGFTDGDLESLLAAGHAEDDDSDGDPDGELPTVDRRDRPATIPDDPISVPGDLWALGKHRLLCGDATNPDDVDRVLDGLGDPGIVWADPPYGINAVGKDGKVGDSRGSKASPTAGGGAGTFVATTQYAPVAGDDTTETAADAFRLLLPMFPQARHVWWGANHYASSAGLPDAAGWLVWDKQTNGDFADAELAWTNYGGAVRRLVHLWNGMARATEKSTKRVPPTQKPIRLAEWAYGIVDKHTDRLVVLDVCAGAGGALLAADATGRTCAAIELTPAYVDAICRRWQQQTGQKPERITADGAREPVDFTDPDE